MDLGTEATGVHLTAGVTNVVSFVCPGVSIGAYFFTLRRFFGGSVSSVDLREAACLLHWMVATPSFSFLALVCLDLRRFSMLALFLLAYTKQASYAPWISSERESLSYLLRGLGFGNCFLNV